MSTFPDELSPREYAPKAEAVPELQETASHSAGVTPERVAEATVADALKGMQALMEDMKIPSSGVYMNDRHQYWLNAEGPVPSVTTVLDIIDKPAVGVFKAKEAARAVWHAMENYRNPPAGFPTMEDEAIKWALQEADKVRDKAASLGSSVHLLADLVGNAPQGQETVSTGFGVDESTFPYIEAYRGFLDRYSVSSIVSSEHAVWSLNGYAGTYDLMMQLPCQSSKHDDWTCEQGHTIPELKESCEGSELWLIDIKTSGKGPYPEWGLQLAGYRWADYIVLPGDPTLYPMPEIQRAGVLHLGPDLYPDTGWRLIEYPITYALDYVPFLAALELYKWKESKRFTKSKLIGRQSKR